MNRKSLEKIIPTFIEISPEKLVARQNCDIKIVFSLEIDLPEFTSIKFRFRGGRNNKNDWYTLQSEDNSTEGFASLKAGELNDFIPVVITGKELSVKFIVSNTSGIKRGTPIVFNIYKTLSQSLEENYKLIEIFIEIPGKPALKVNPVPTIEINAQLFHHITVICPSTVQPSESFKTLLRFEDKFHNLYKQVGGEIHLQIIDIKDKYTSNLNSVRIEIQKDFNGVLKLENFHVSKPGIYKIKVQFRDRNYLSNPIWCRNESIESQINLYWGFIHAHSTYSDGVRDLEEFFDNLISAGLDFGTTTEHDHSWETSDDDFTQVKEIVEKSNSRNDFSSLFGYEYGKWYSGQGDICVYSKDKDLKVLRSEVNKFNSLTKLFSQLKTTNNKDVLLIAHHTALKSGYRNWDYFDNDLEKLVEIYSTWGNQEYLSLDGNPLPPRYKFFGYGKYARDKGPILEKKGSTVIDALKKGYKLGFTAGGDDHFGNYPSGPINPDTGMYSPGILAVWSKANTREDIWNSLVMRHCYGTTGPRIILEFSIDNQEMGDIVQIDNISILNTYRLFKFRIISPIRVKSLEIVRNGDVLISKKYDKFVIEDDLTDSDLFSDIALTHISKTERFIFYYLRIFLDFENMAWSSPIWIIKND